MTGRRVRLARLERTRPAADPVRVVIVRRIVGHAAPGEDLPVIRTERRAVLLYPDGLPRGGGR